MKNLPSAFYSIQNVVQIVNLIIDKSFVLLCQTQLNKKIPYHSQQYLKQIINQMFQIFGCEYPLENKNPLIQDNEAKCLIVDNFMPASLNFQMKQNYQSKQQQISEKKSQTKLSSRLSKRNLQNKKKKGQESPFKQIQSIKLQEQEDKYIKTLREKKVMTTIQQNKKKNKKPAPKSNKLQQNKVQDIAFDFNGDVIKLVKPSSTNLVKHAVSANINENPKNDKKQNGPQSIIIPNILMDALKKKKSAIVDDKNHQIIPLNDIPMHQFELSQGIKLSTNKKTQQNFRKPMLLGDLKQKYKDLRLSRDDFNRLRQHQKQQMGKQIHFIKKQDKKNIQIEKLQKKQIVSARNPIEVQKPKTFFSKNSQSKVVVNNIQLKTIHIDNYKAAQQIRPKENKLISNKDEGKQQKSPNDKHLQFILQKSKSITNIPKSKTKQILPQLKHQNSGTSLKIRQRIKNQKQILIEINKKFEDRLRSSTNIYIKRN